MLQSWSCNGHVVRHCKTIVLIAFPYLLTILTCMILTSFCFCFDAFPPLSLIADDEGRFGPVVLPGLRRPWPSKITKHKRIIETMKQQIEITKKQEKLSKQQFRNAKQCCIYFCLFC